uniref:Uncharacterized protein n=1 Tax=Anguilla anguilla TaxID=7936 RepID=A0A0E9TJ01_ANGAN
MAPSAVQRAGTIFIWMFIVGSGGDQRGVR